ISISGIEDDDLAHIRLKDVTLRIIGRSNKPVSLGDLYGNEFEITIRGLKGSEDEILQRINSISAEIDAMGGIPNFFGVQRFGINRPITHIVGERLIRGDVKGAVMTYLAYITPDESESEEVREARQLCQEGNFKECLKRMPLRYERAILNELVKVKKSTEQLSESDYIAAFNALPVNLQKLFIHAYQAYLFNLVLSKRMMSLNMNRQQPFNAALVGDIVCYRNEHGFADPAKLERVTEEKVDAINRLIKRGRAFVTAPVFGFATELGAGLEGEIEREVLTAEGIELSDFKLNVLPALSSKGTRRPIIVPVKVNCKELSDDEMNPGCKRVKLNFFLPKGSYATVVLREYMKMK
ncbi:tRNA pseudouridine(13) synthase TruD, partial [Methanosarcinales archaeon]